MILFEGALGCIIKNHCVLIALLHDGQLGNLDKFMGAVAHQKVQLSCLHHQNVLIARQRSSNTTNTLFLFLVLLLLTDQIR